MTDPTLSNSLADLAAHRRGAPSLTDLRNAARLVLRVSSPTVAPVDGSVANPPASALPMPRHASPGRIEISSGISLMITRYGHRKALRRSKPASALRPGDAIRLETGRRVVITYVSPGFAPTDRYIEWRGPNNWENWANVPLDAMVRLAWQLPRVWTPRE